MYVLTLNSQLLSDPATLLHRTLQNDCALGKNNKTNGLTDWPTNLKLLCRREAILGRCGNSESEHPFMWWCECECKPGPWRWIIRNAICWWRD